MRPRTGNERGALRLDGNHPTRLRRALCARRNRFYRYFIFFFLRRYFGQNTNLSLSNSVVGFFSVTTARMYKLTIPRKVISPTRARQVDITVRVWRASVFFFLFLFPMRISHSHRRAFFFFFLKNFTDNFPRTQIKFK